MGSVFEVGAHFKDVMHRVVEFLILSDPTGNVDEAIGTGVGTDRPKNKTTTVAFFEFPVFIRVFVGILSLFVAFLSLFLSLFET